jgi:hypothetical protein
MSPPQCPDRLWSRTKLSSSGYLVLFPRGKESVIDQLYLISEVKNTWSYIPTPPYVFMPWWLRNEKWEQVYFTLYENISSTSFVKLLGYDRYRCKNMRFEEYLIVHMHFL